jgi:hypothetical protein
MQGQEQQDCSPCQEAGDGHGYNRPVPGGWGGDSGAHGLLITSTHYMPDDFPSRDKKHLA